MTGALRRRRRAKAISVAWGDWLGLTVALVLLVAVVAGHAPSEFVFVAVVLTLRPIYRLLLRDLADMATN